MLLAEGKNAVVPEFEPKGFTLMETEREQWEAIKDKEKRKTREVRRRLDQKMRYDKQGRELPEFDNQTIGGNAAVGAMQPQRIQYDTVQEEMPSVIFAAFADSSVQGIERGTQLETVLEHPNTVLEYPLEQAVYHASEGASATEVLLDTGASMGMGSAQKLNKFRAAVKKEGYHVPMENSSQKFTFAGGGSSQRSAGKARVPVPALKADTMFDAVECPGDGPQTPLLWSIGQSRNAKQVHIAHQDRMLCKRGDDVWVWLKLRTSSSGHQFFETQQEGEIADLEQPLSAMLGLSKSQRAKQSKNC